MGGTQRATQITKELSIKGSGAHETKSVIGILTGLKSDYELGLLDNLPEMIEANVASDYMAQAESLLAEGRVQQFDHVPAAVLAGAVLEDSLRRLCNRQLPPIPVIKENGEPKTFDPLITDLQKAGLYSTAKADQLRSWSKIRNYAAHGEFSKFNRNEVEAMIAGIKSFLADFM